MAEGDAGIVGHRQDQFGVAQVVQALLAAPLEHVLGQRQVAAPGRDRRNQFASALPTQVTHRVPAISASCSTTSGWSRRCRRNAARPGRRSARPLRANRVRGKARNLFSMQTPKRSRQSSAAPEFAAHRGVGRACLSRMVAKACGKRELLKPGEHLLRLRDCCEFGTCRPPLHFVRKVPLLHGGSERAIPLTRLRRHSPTAMMIGSFAS